ncbi:hypothetical protein DPMN_123489, partial [Dreissena polymorpha]
MSVAQDTSWHKLGFGSLKSHTFLMSKQKYGGQIVNVSGEKGLKELIEEGKPVEILEGDGYNNIEIPVKRNINLTLQKRFDKNHVKN